MADCNMGKPNENSKTEGAGEGCCGVAMTTADIREHMEVIASCGKRVGVVDRVEGDTIKLTKKDGADGQHHHVPLEWIARVDQHFHLTKNSEEVEHELAAEAIGA